MLKPKPPQPFAREETKRLRVAHGALSSSFARRVLMTGRHLERLIAGCYNKVTVDYLYADDEVPNYKAVAAKVGSRWTFGHLMVEVDGRDGNTAQ